MNLLTMEHVTKIYTERPILDQADFSIQEREKIGVIAVNGMGKSTLLRLAAGIEEPDAGTVVKGGNVKIAYLSQNPQFPTGLKALEAASGQSRHMDVTSEAKSMLTKLGMTDYDMPVEQLSGGQRKRLALIRTLLEPSDILILDEPTNHLDNSMSQWLEDYLLRYHGALLMVTHDRYFLDRISTRIIEVERGKLYSYPGSYSEYVRLKEERQNSAIAGERKRQSILRTELEWLARGARARSTKQKAHIDRIEKLQEQKAPEKEQAVQMSSMSSRMGGKTVEARGISKAYGEKTLIQDFQYIFLKNDRIGIIGKNGCGKSTLLKILIGQILPDEGSVEIGQTIKLGYFSQENEAMDENLRVIDYIRETAEFIQTPEGKLSCTKMLERFLFDSVLQYSRIEKLSGGEKRRLYLLKVLMDAPNVLLLDEPTNDLDIQTLTILEDYLDGFSGIVIAVSHDRYFLDRVVRRIFAFEEEGHLQQYEGGYSDYLEASQLRRQPVRAEKEKPLKQKTERVREKKLKFTFQEEREYGVIDEEIAALEEQSARLEEEVAANAHDFIKLGELMKEKESVEKELEEKLERWEYLTELAERIEEEKKGRNE